MKSIIIFVIVALLSATRADETTTVPGVKESDITTQKDIVAEIETEATLLTEQPTVTTVVISTTIPTTIAASTSTASPPTTTTTTERIPTTTTERIQPPTTVPTTTTTIRQTTPKPISTTSIPPTIRSRSRVAKARLTDESTSKPDLLTIKLLKSDTIDSRSRGRPSVTAAPRIIPINVIRSEPTPSWRRFQSYAAPTSAPSENEILVEKEDKSARRGKLRYLSGKELGRDAPPINFESKYEADRYKFKYETKDGQTRAENGIFENMGTEEQNYIVKGSYSYFDTDGIEYIVNYTADNRGFHPVITVNNPNRKSAT